MKAEIADYQHLTFQNYGVDNEKRSELSQQLLAETRSCTSQQAGLIDKVPLQLCT